MAMIARNNLVAAAQNIQGAQRYLSNVEFPYCSPSEVSSSGMNIPDKIILFAAGCYSEQGHCVHLH